MGLLKNYCTLLIFLLCMGCEEEQVPDENFVVEAFLFAGEKNHRISVKKVHSIYTSETTSEPIPDAEVALIKNSVIYPLIYDVTTERYRYIGNDLNVNIRDRFEIRVGHRNRLAAGSTVVPEATKGLTISGNKIVIPPITVRFGIADELRALFANGRLTLNWENPQQQLHFVVIENVTSGDPIFPQGFPIPEGTLSLIQSFRYITAPTTATRFEIPGLSLDTYGTYRAKVYQVNQEYADLYLNQIQDSRDLNPPPSNIKNALGIFSAFASDSVFFSVSKQ